MQTLVCEDENDSKCWKDHQVKHINRNYLPDDDDDDEFQLAVQGRWGMRRLNTCTYAVHPTNLQYSF
jgi:hypothetical protein